MATAPMRSILTLLFIAVCCNCQSIGSGISSSWAKLQISPDTLTSMEYGNFLVEIYEHANNRKVTASEKKYFYSPITLLDYKNATSRLNNVTKKPEMRFRIEMWNDKVQNEVVKLLKKIVGKEIQSDKVRVIPFEKVILKSNIPTTDYSLSSAWTIYDKSKALWFHLFCEERKVCDELAKEMRSDPTQFHHFKLLYSLSSQTSQTKQTTISIGSFTSGQMVSTLLQKFGDKNEIFLTANDEKKMFAEMATNIRMEILDDSEVVSPDTESQILNILTDLLVVSRPAIKDQSDKMWDSVFWNEDNYRPDKTTKTLNEIIQKLDKENQKKLVDLFQKAERQSEIGKDEEKRQEKQLRSENQSKDANVDRISSTISGKMAKDSDSSRRVENLKEVKKLLQESRDYVQWDGEKFVPKPMKLSRINLRKFRDSQSFQDRNVRVRYTTAELSAPIKFMDHAGLTVTDEWNNLKDELREMRELLKTTMMNLTKTNAELSNVKQNLTNTKIDLTKKLEGTKQELGKTKTEMEKTNAHLKKAVTDLSKQLNATEEEIKMSAGKLSWELKGSQQELAKIKTELETKEIKEELMKSKIELTETRADLSKIVDDLSKKLNANSQRFGYELKTAEENLRKELGEILNDLETTTTDLASARTELSNTKSAVSDLTTKLNARTNEIVDIGKMPTSCWDLERMGQKVSGFFSVKGAKMMETVYCDFNPNENDKQKWIGYADVKSAPVHFYVQRNSSSTLGGSPIPFDLVRLNEGNAMNLTSGIFTAPRPGIYLFSFMEKARVPNIQSSFVLEVCLYLNESQIETGHVKESNTANEPWTPLILQSTLKLKTGDRVWLQRCFLSLRASLLVDKKYHSSYFTGLLLEEEIFTSL